MIALLAIGQLLDALTLAYVGQTAPWALAYEQSPITAALIAFGGVWFVLAVKAALVAAIALAHRLGAGNAGLRWRVLIALVALSGFVGAISNLAALGGVS